MSTSSMNELNRAILEFKSNVDKNLGEINASVNVVDSNATNIYNNISKFRQEIVLNEEKQIAQENIIRIDQEIKEMYGNYDEVRKTIMGVVRDFDINLVRNTSMQEISEELWITNSRYWLSYAMVAISAWVNNYKNVAENALAECYRRDKAKCTLFFCLMNLRFKRARVAKSWFKEYLTTINPEQTNRETAILIQAYLNGVFGSDKELECEVNNIIQGWIAELRDNKKNNEELTNAYFSYISVLPIKEKCEYGELKQYCEEYSKIVETYIKVSKYDELIKFLDNYQANEEDNYNQDYKKKIDSILIMLVTNFDDEEIVLKNEQKKFKFILDNNGNKGAAEKQYEEFMNLQSESFNIGKHMISWSLYEDNIDIKVKKFSIENSKSWFKDAVEKWNELIKVNAPIDFKLNIDGWCSVTNGGDHNSQIENMSSYYESRKFQLMYINKINIIVAIVFILSICFAFITPFSLIVSLISGITILVRILGAKKKYLKKCEEAKDKLNRCMIQIADYKKYYITNIEKKDTVIGKIEYV